MIPFYHIIHFHSISLASSLLRMSPIPKTSKSQTTNLDTPPVLYPYISDPVSTSDQRTKGPGRPRATRGRPPKTKTPISPKAPVPRDPQETSTPVIVSSTSIPVVGDQTRLEFSLPLAHGQGFAPGHALFPAFASLIENLYNVFDLC
jgi:hypothetical protein